MSAPTDLPENGPPEDAIVEAYLLGHLGEEQRQAIQGRFEMDPQAAQRLASLRGELAILRTMLSLAAEEAGGINEESLARYLDGTLPETDRDVLEDLLAGNPEAQHRLLRLYREVCAVRQAASPGSTADVDTPMAEQHYAGEEVSFEEHRRHPEEAGGSSSGSGLSEDWREGRQTRGGASE